MKISYKKPKINKLKKKKTKILGFFHIATMLKHENRWKSIVDELMNDLNNGGLLKNTDLLTKVYLGPEACKFKNKTTKNIKIISAGADLSLYEGPTLRNLWERCMSSDEEFYVYYIHTKGVSYPPNTKSESWRQSMSDAVILNWKKCVKILDSGEKTCGIMFKPLDLSFYRGNFWWARASYIRTLEKPESNNRYYYEGWLSPPKRVVLEGYPRLPDYKGYAIKEIKKIDSQLEATATPSAAKRKFDPNKMTLREKRTVRTTKEKILLQKVADLKTRIAEKAKKAKKRGIVYKIFSHVLLLIKSLIFRR